MGFLNSLLLFGMTAISVPIIIHLINRRRIQRVTWAAMRFLRVTIQQNQRRLRIEDLILLALRCLLLILLALALARPVFRAGGFSGTGQVKSTAVILLDNSYSMGLSDGAQTRFEKATKAAEELVDALPGGSAMAIWLASDTVRPLIPEPSRDLNLARKVVREAKLSSRGSDLLPSLQQSVKLLGERTALRKEIYLLTDGQALAWKQWEQITGVLGAAKSEIHTHLILVGEPEDHNLAVSNLRFASGLATLDQPLRFEVQVTNTGKEPIRDVRVSLHVDNDPPSEEGTIAEIPAGAGKSISLFAKLRAEGFHSVTARIPGDRLTADDQRTVVVRALRELRVLLVDGEPGHEPRESETFFLRHALVPAPPADANRYFVKVRVATAPELLTTRLDDYDVIGLANVFDLPAQSVAALDQYLTRGGGLLVFPGGNINRAFYNERLFLPASFGEPVGDADNQEKFRKLQEKDYEHPFVTIWNDPAAGTLGSARFFKAYPLSPAPWPDKRSSIGGAPRVVLKYDDGTPAVMERTWGLGRVIQFSSTADTAWNDLPVRPSFVPLLYRAVGGLVERQDEGLNVAVGEPFAYRVGSDYFGKDTKFALPAGSALTRDFGRVELVGTVPMVRYQNTDMAGVYEANIQGDAPLAMRFAAQPSTVESSLLSLSVPQLGQLSTLAQVFRYPSETSLRERVEQAVVGTEICAPLLWLAVLVGVVETLLGQWFSRSK